MWHQGQYPPLEGHMSRYPRDPWEATYGQPLRVCNQRFGNGLMDEELPPLDSWAMMHPRRKSLHRHSTVSQISCTNDEFQVKVDVHQFLPQELKVKVVENYVVVEGHHGEMEDQHGLIQRTFKRRYRLPENVKEDQLICDLSVDGVLQIRVPRIVESHHDPNEVKLIPIHQTGKQAIASGVSKPSPESGHHFHSLK